MPRRTLRVLPGGWSRHVRSSAVHAVSLAFDALTRAWAKGSTSPSAVTRLRADLDRASTEIALLREELALKDARWRRVPSRRRPHFAPVDRMRILKLKAARAWSRATTARVFGVTELTIVNWKRRLDEGGERALVQLPQPVNTFPAYVGDLVRWCKTMCPALGKLRIAQALARAGLEIGATTVGRMLKEAGSIDDPVDVALEQQSRRGAVATAPNEVWHVDLTAVPTAKGFWLPSKPSAKLVRWPFGWWIAVIVDQFSRRVQGFALFERVPTAQEVSAMLGRAVERHGRPRCVVVDRGRQFDCGVFRGWCDERDVDLRSGAVGRHASIAVVERFIRSMKAECTRQIVVPFRSHAMREELACYATWYNEHRPHQSLDGRTPNDVYEGRTVEPSRLEPRLRMPAVEDAEHVQHFRLVVRPFAGRRHLPVIALKRAA